MPRKSQYQIVLTDKEKDTLRMVSRKYMSSYCDVVRAKAILLAAEDHTNKQIGEWLDLSRQIVSKWRKRFCRERLAGLESRPCRGRPRLFSS